MGNCRLCYEDCLEDSPQTRALIGVYEHDSIVLLEFIKSLKNIYNEIASIQNQLAIATGHLSTKLRQFSNLSNSLNLNVGGLCTTTNEVAVKVEEISMINRIAFNELVESLEGPNLQFGNDDFEEFYRLKANFHSSDSLHEDAAARHARISKKKINEKSWKEASDQLYAARKTFHNTSMMYCSCLNSLQNKKDIGVLKPAISLIKSQVSYAVLSEDHRKGWLKTVEDICLYFNKIKENDEIMRKESLKCIDSLDAASTRAYIPDPPASLNFPDLPANKNKNQISGYLFQRSRGTILTQWNRNYFFTQGSNLMKQSKMDLGGQLLIDLENCRVNKVEQDDRRHVFQITSGNKQVVLQAESKHQLEEWIATLTNISTAYVILQNEHLTLVAEQKISSPSVKTTTKLQKSYSVDEPATKPDSLASTSSSMLMKIKQAATNLVSPSTTTVQEKQLKSEDKLKNLIGPESTNILFNLSKIGDLLPTTDKSETSDSGITNNEESFTSKYSCHFLGCKEVTGKLIANDRGDGRSRYQLIDDTIWQVMAGRAIHKVMTTTDVVLQISLSDVCLLDSTAKSVLKVFMTSDIRKVQTHAENQRLFGIIVTSSHANDGEMTCYVFENFESANEICCTFDTAKAIHQSKLEFEKTKIKTQKESSTEELKSDKEN